LDVLILALPARDARTLSWFRWQGRHHCGSLALSDFMPGPSIEDFFILSSFEPKSLAIISDCSICACAMPPVGTADIGNIGGSSAKLTSTIVDQKVS
jgi:hypothetical protein